MDINQVRFGNYSIGNPQVGAKKSEAKTQENVQPEVQKEGVKNEVNAENILSALNIAGTQNLAQINFAAKKEINPADYLSPERIADIEAMMAGFENGVNAVADVIEAEIPGLSEANKNALAAGVYAQE